MQALRRVANLRRLAPPGQSTIHEFMQACTCKIEKIIWFTHLRMTSAAQALVSAVIQHFEVQLEMQTPLLAAAGQLTALESW